MGIRELATLDGLQRCLESSTRAVLLAKWSGSFPQKISKSNQENRYWFLTVHHLPFLQVLMTCSRLIKKSGPEDRSGGRGQSRTQGQQTMMIRERTK